jgi:peptidoglycan/LPS O-acetylase OafA/YrhL
VRLEQLTFTRYLAALTVVFFHYGNTVFPANLPLLNPVLAAGPIAVSYFYALSGFIMAIAYYAPNSQRPFNTWRYWWARVARIYPVYLLALLLMVAAKFKVAGSDPGTILLSVGMLQAWIPGYPLTLNAPGWSLSVEAFFYLSFPLLILLAKRHHLTVLAAGITLWFITQIGHTLLLNSSDYRPFSHLHDIIYYNPVMHLSTFVIGFITGAWLREGKLRMLAPARINTAGLFVVSLLVIGLLIIRQPLITYTGIHFDYTNGLIAPLFLLLIVLLALNTTRISTILQHSWLVLLGEASFSLYILQKPLHGIYEKLIPASIAPGSTLHFYLFLVILTGTALFSYRFFETPLRHSINNFVNRVP